MAALCEAVASGDADAFETLYVERFPMVLACARACTRRDESFCLDIVQDVMMRTAAKLPRLTGEPALCAWLTRTTVCASLDALRTERRRAKRERGRVVSQASGSTQADDRIGAEEELHQLLGQLSHMDHVLLISAVVAGSTLRQAALAAGLNENAANGRFRRLVQRLRASLVSGVGEKERCP